MKKPTDFARLLGRFLTEELPGIRNLSSNTIKSYRDTYVLFLQFMEESCSIKAEKLEVKDVTQTVIKEFLGWLESRRANCTNTRNQRLAAIHALFRYIQVQIPAYMFQSQQILAIPFKKYKKTLIRYLDQEETKNLLNAPDTSTKKGRRDQTLLCILYDSGARVQELADLKVMDLRLETPALVVITGKGRKTRHVPLMEKTVLIMKRYLKENGLEHPSKMEHPLFYNCHGYQLTRQGIAYILRKYTDGCSIGRVSPHKIRHTKAMHLTEADVNPIYIRDFLGHTDLKVTEVYSKTSLRMKKQALEKMNVETIPEVTNDWSDDKDLMEWLTSLGH